MNVLTRIRSCCLLIFISCAASTFVFALQSSDLEQRLTTVYKGKEIELQKPFCGTELEFDSSGTLIAGGATGPWTLCRRIRVEGIHVYDNILTLTGRRIYLFYDQTQHIYRDINEIQKTTAETYKELTRREQVSIRIHLSSILDAAAVQASTDAVFDLLPRVEKETTIVIPLKKITDSDIFGSDVFQVGEAVTAPKPLQTPEPDYTDEARLTRFEGTGLYHVVITKEGKVTWVVPTRMLGMGLDEKAEDMIRTWLFAPARKDGKPVAVTVNIEVAFHLY